MKIFKTFFSRDNKLFATYTAKSVLYKMDLFILPIIKNARNA